MEKHYRFAGIELAVRIPEDRMYRDDLQLTNFRVEQVSDPHRYRLSVVPELTPPQGPELACLPGSRVYAAEGGCDRYYGPVQDSLDAAYTRVEHRGKEHHIMLSQAHTPKVVSVRQVLNALDVEHLVVDAGGVILHASYIAWEGRGILFTAPSETGKSTQAELWKVHRGADIINGDRAVMMPGQGGVCAAGLPYSGSSPYCENRTLPLAAVVYLRQAPVTTIRKLRGLEAFRHVWEGCCINTWDRNDVEQTMAFVESLIGQVGVYELACTPDESAVNALEEQLRKQGRE